MSQIEPVQDRRIVPCIPEPESGRENRAVVEYIPVVLTPEEFHMKQHADHMEMSLKQLITEDQWLRLCCLLQEHGNKKHLNEQKFMEEMSKILEKEKYNDMVGILKSYWNLKAPLLQKSFRLAQTGR